MTSTSTTSPVKRPVAAGKDTFGTKALIMLMSVVVTLGGWGLLAARQAIEAIPARTAPQSVIASESITRGPTLRQVNPSQVQQRPFARTRSSR